MLPYNPWELPLSQGFFIFRSSGLRFVTLYGGVVKKALTYYNVVFIFELRLMINQYDKIKGIIMSFSTTDFILTMITIYFMAIFFVSIF
jgi:hypothetical protein